MLCVCLSVIVSEAYQPLGSYCVYLEWDFRTTRKHDPDVKIFYAGLDRDKQRITFATTLLTKKITKLESSFLGEVCQKEREVLCKQIAEFKVQLGKKKEQELLLDSQLPIPFWVRQCRSVQDRGLRYCLTAEQPWDTLALAKILAGFMRDVFAPVLGVSDIAEVHAAKEMVHMFGNVVGQRNTRAHNDEQNLPIANVLDAIRCLHDIALRCQRANAEKVDAKALMELAFLKEHTSQCIV